MHLSGLQPHAPADRALAGGGRAEREPEAKEGRKAAGGIKAACALCCCARASVRARLIVAFGPRASFACCAVSSWSTRPTLYPFASSAAMAASTRFSGQPTWRLRWQG